MRVNETGERMKAWGFPSTKINAKVFKGSATSIDPEATKTLKERSDLVVTDLRTIAVQGLTGPDNLAPLAEAKALLPQRAYELVILDVELPDGSGLELMPLLHQHGAVDEIQNSFQHGRSPGNRLL